jgi:hypothetical protein
MDNKCLSILDSLIPGRIPKAILGLTIVLSFALLKYAPFRSLISSPLTKLEEAGIQWIPVMLVLLFGSSLLAVSLIYEIHKAKDDLTKTQAASRSLNKSLVIIMQLVTEEKNRIKERHAALQSKDPATYTVDTLSEVGSLHDSKHFIEKISATVLRYVDSNEANSRPVNAYSEKDSH